MTLEEIEMLPREYLTAREVAAILGISANNFYKNHSRMSFPVLHFGRNYRIPKQPFLEYMRTGRPTKNYSTD